MGRSSGDKAINFNAYSDFDAFSKDVRHIDGQLLLKDSARPRWTIRHIELCGIHLQIGSSGSGSIFEGTSSAAGYLVYMPLSQFEKQAANGIVLDESLVLFMTPASEFCLSVEGPHEWALIFVPVRTGHLSFEAAGRQRSGVLRVAPDGAHRLRSLVRETESAVSAGSNFELTPAAALVADELVALIASILVEESAADLQRSGRPMLSRQEIIRRCKHMHEGSGSRRVKVAEMAERLAISERTLGAVFREYYGVGPARYFQLRRYRQIHIALHGAQSEWETVAEVLGRHGEWQPGRFAKRYRDLFGEWPSQTLGR